MAEITMADFKARNAEAQRINAEIQKAQGARDENERQFKRLCAEYANTYGEAVDENNLEAILSRVTAEVNAQAEIQAQAIEAARKGIVTHKPVVASGTANNAVAGNGVPQTGNGVPQTGNGVPQTGNGAIAGVPSGIPQGTVGVPNMTAPAPNMAVPPVGVPNMAGQGAGQSVPQGITQYQTPVFGQQMTLDEPKPVSVANLSSAAIAQSNTQPNLTQPKEVATHTQVEATSPINGWTPTQGNNVDFNTMLGGKFGG